MKQCKNCLSEDLMILITTSEYSLIKCNSCAFFFKDIGETNYESLQERDYTCFNYDRKNEVIELDSIIRKFCKKNKIRVLEIGSGTSAILNELDKFGYDVFGVEPSKAAIKISKEVFPHIEVINDYFTSGLIAKEVDVMLLNDVVEHLEPNNPLFKEISDFMGLGTLLLIKSGNPLSLNAQLFISHWRYTEAKQHISFYSLKALKKFCEKLNLNLVKHYKFQHAYGGLHLLIYLKNILIFFLMKFRIDTLLKRNFSIELANDHFIAVIKKNIF
jgi:2-polyprenyl-3-methyl-5-hydroxy-6-metoxy-1,4-benzoquinol methylase